MTATVTATPTELASEFNTDGKTFRKFLRSITPKDEQPGKGGRWAVPATKRDITKLRKQFADWNAAEQAARAERAAKAAAEAAQVATEVDTDEDTDLELDD